MIIIKVFIIITYILFFQFFHCLFIMSPLNSNLFWLSFSMFPSVFKRFCLCLSSPLLLSSSLFISLVISVCIPLYLSVFLYRFSSLSLCLSVYISISPCPFSLQPLSLCLSQSLSISVSLLSGKLCACEEKLPLCFDCQSCIRKDVWSPSRYVILI